MSAEPLIRTSGATAAELSGVFDADPEGVLLALVANGDQLAFAELYDRICGDVFRGIVPKTGGARHREAVTLNAFLEIWTRSPLFASSGDSASLWISAIVLRHAQALSD